MCSHGMFVIFGLCLIGFAYPQEVADEYEVPDKAADSSDYYAWYDDWFPTTTRQDDSSNTGKHVWYDSWFPTTTLQDYSSNTGKVVWYDSWFPTTTRQDYSSNTGKHVWYDSWFQTTTHQYDSSNKENDAWYNSWFQTTARQEYSPYYYSSPSWHYSSYKSWYSSSPHIYSSYYDSGSFYQNGYRDGWNQSLGALLSPSVLYAMFGATVGVVMLLCVTCVIVCAIRQTRKVPRCNHWAGEDGVAIIGSKNLDAEKAGSTTFEDEDVGLFCYCRLGQLLKGCKCSVSR